MFRFAINATSDMHIGDLKIAIYNYIVSHQKKEDMIIRIEDIDIQKDLEAKDKETLDILNLFGINYSQIIYQSETIRFYSAMALQLIHDKKAFSCFCSDEWLDKKKKEAQITNQEYKYDDACRDLPHELVIDNMNPFRIRIKKPTSSIVIDDLIKGSLAFDIEAMESFVILNQQKVPLNYFATAVDDMLNDISLVIRSEEYLENAPKEKHIRNMLNYDKNIEYAHIRLNEEEKSITVKSLLENGFLPEAIISALFQQDSNCTAIVMLDELISFSINDFVDSPIPFSYTLLQELNRQYLHNLDSKELSRYVGFADENIGDLAKVYLDFAEISTTKALKEKVAVIFEEKVIEDEFQEDVNSMKAILKDAPYFEQYEDFKEFILQTLEIKSDRFVMILRLLLTGDKDGPNIEDIYKYLKNYLGEIIK